MFQVASHSSAFAMHGHSHGHGPHHPSMSMSMGSTSPSGIQLPRTLSRPAFTDVSRDAIMAVAPELASVPPEYIRRGLRPKAHQYVYAPFP